jgi:hypothetical protein
MNNEEGVYGMQEIVAHIEKVLHCIVPFEKEAFRERIDRDSHLHWPLNFPVAVVHHRSRMDEASRDFFEEEGLFGTGGYTTEVYTVESLRQIASQVPPSLKQVSFLCLGREDEVYTYNPKHEGDKWKKILDNGTFKAVIELSVYHEGGIDICKMETELRDLMRSSKEVPSLKEIGFVWIAIVPKTEDAEPLLSHYFGVDWLKVEEETHTAYIGWSEKLAEVDMRGFVCSPDREKV